MLLSIVTAAEYWSVHDPEYWHYILAALGDAYITICISSIGR